MLPRQNTEAVALAPFKSIADELGLTYFSGQVSGNRLPILPNVYFQFGDLRIELPAYTLVVEVESAGGVTNLVKYWEALASGRVQKPVKLLHVFLQKSANDYEAHMIVWRFLASLMQVALGAKWEARCIPTRGASVESLEPALATFRLWLAQGAA